MDVQAIFDNVELFSWQPISWEKAEVFFTFHEKKSNFAPASALQTLFIVESLCYFNILEHTTK